MHEIRDIFEQCLVASGRPADDERLRRSVALYNEVRGVIRQLYAARREQPRTVGDAPLDLGGIRGMEELERRVDGGRAGVAFALWPTSLDEVMAVADAGLVMPGRTDNSISRVSGGQWATNSRSSGRGPTKLMSPFRTFSNCGSSLSLVSRSQLPTGVIRESPWPVTLGPL